MSKNKSVSGENDRSISSKNYIEISLMWIILKPGAITRIGKIIKKRALLRNSDISINQIIDVSSEVKQ